MILRRVGLLGGAFNPPHDGHLKLARLALEQLDLDELRLVPTALSPHKPDPGGPDGPTRLRLLDGLLAEADGRCRIETLELERGGASYTVDTLEALTAREPGAGWILVMGSDQLPGLPRWHRVERVFQLASAAIAPRPGAPLEEPGVPLRPVARWSGGPGERVWLPPTDLDLASTALRKCFASDSALDPEGLPAQVLAAIRAENLYR